MKALVWFVIIAVSALAVLSALPEIDPCSHTRAMVAIWEADPRPEAKRDGWPPETLDDVGCVNPAQPSP